MLSGCENVLVWGRFNNTSQVISHIIYGFTEKESLFEYGSVA